VNACDASNNDVLEMPVRVRTKELERRNQAVRRSQFYLSEGQRLTHTGSWAFDPGGFFDYWSEELFHIYGLAPAQCPPPLAQYLARVHTTDRDYYKFIPLSLARWDAESMQPRVEEKCELRLGVPGRATQWPEELSS